MTEANSLQTFVTSTDGARISVTVTGQGRPLVLVHGSLSTSADWQRVADSLVGILSQVVGEPDSEPRLLLLLLDDTPELLSRLAQRMWKADYVPASRET